MKDCKLHAAEIVPAASTAQATNSSQQADTGAGREKSPRWRPASRLLLPPSQGFPGVLQPMEEAGRGEGRRRGCGRLGRGTAVHERLL